MASEGEKFLYETKFYLTLKTTTKLNLVYKF